MEYLKNPSKFNFDFEAYEKFYSVFTSAETTKYTEIQKKKFLVLYASSSSNSSCRRAR